MGSTAVPRLPAKLIIDIQLGVPGVGDDDAHVPYLVAAGYRLHEPGHRMVRTPELDVHFAICAAGSDWERPHLLFRDWLGQDEPDREA